MKRLMRIRRSIIKCLLIPKLSRRKQEPTSCCTSCCTKLPDHSPLSLFVGGLLEPIQALMLIITRSRFRLIIFHVGGVWFRLGFQRYTIAYVKTHGEHGWGHDGGWEGAVRLPSTWMHGIFSCYLPRFHMMWAAQRRHASLCNKQIAIITCK